MSKPAKRKTQSGKRLPKQIAPLVRNLVKEGFDRDAAREMIDALLARGVRIEVPTPLASRLEGFVRWEGRALGKVREDLRPLLEQELSLLFNDADCVQVTVEDCFAGYHGDQERKIILGVEVRLSSEVRTHIIKLGVSEQVRPDFDGWTRCVGNRYVGSRLFVRPVYKELPAVSGRERKEVRGAVIYPNAYQLFGLDQKTQHPESLHDVMHWAVLDHQPTAASIERVIMQIYGDLFRWFYAGARSESVAAEQFYQRRLERALGRWASSDAADWDEQRGVSRRVELRRDAVWLFCGLDRPDAREPAVYLDPFDFVSWALDQHRVPDTVIGRSHGDLHGLNILVGVHRGEAEFPVVFDYGEMSHANVLAWDFVKLEFELKTRLLPMLYRDEQVRGLLLARRGKKPPRENVVGANASENVRECAERARRLAFVFEFETLLAQATARIENRDIAASRCPPGPLPLFGGNKEVDVALSILLRIRQEAALWLGYEQSGRQDRWRDEYYFASAVYGLCTAKWPNYDAHQTECALVAAGVACAQMRLAQQVLRGGTVRWDKQDPDPSYKLPLRRAHEQWSAGRLDGALKTVEQALTRFQAAIPLDVELALLLAEVGRLDEADAKIEPLRQLASIFGDFEMLSRLGRVQKNHADKAWTGDVTPLVYSVPWQYYKKAFECYEEAFQLSDDYFPGINAATLAAILGAEWKVKAKSIARRVEHICSAISPPTATEQRYWLFATEGEAALIPGTADSSRRAADYYRQALGLVDPLTQITWAQSSWGQVCRLWMALGAEFVEPVVQVFEECTEIWRRLKRGPLSNCGR